jgi:hypothetical protein
MYYEESEPHRLLPDFFNGRLVADISSADLSSVEVYNVQWKSSSKPSIT